MTTKIKETPILFSAPMVRAILSGAKTQTRRVVSKSNAIWGSAETEFWNHCDFDAPTCFADNGYLHVPCHAADEYMQTSVKECMYCDEMGLDGTRHRLYPKWQVGNRLWVRETWSLYDEWPVIAYRADDKAYSLEKFESQYRHYHQFAFWINERAKYPDSDKWRPSIFMPRWASRITLEITDVRVQRLQDISEADCFAEGVRALDIEHAFYQLWKSINGEESWDANPWVWAISFRRMQ